VASSVGGAASGLAVAGDVAMAATANAPKTDANKSEDKGKTKTPYLKTIGVSVFIIAYSSAIE
jgi:hypothetical protein